MSKANPVSCRLIRLPGHHSSWSPAVYVTSVPNCADPSRGVSVTDLVTDAHTAV